MLVEQLGVPLKGDHLFETPWEDTLMYHGLMALLCLEKDAGLHGQAWV